jgi:hypothetical protein
MVFRHYNKQLSGSYKRPSAGKLLLNLGRQTLCSVFFIPGPVDNFLMCWNVWSIDWESKGKKVSRKSHPLSLMMKNQSALQFDLLFFHTGTLKN